MTYDPSSSAAIAALVMGMSGKASQSSIEALADAMPIPSPNNPATEALAAWAGDETKWVSREGHVHPRSTSVTYGAIGSGGTATVTFSRSFPTQPGLMITEIAGSATQPAVFKVESWVTSSGRYTGCVVRAWRSQTIPQNLVTLLLGSVFNIFGGAVSGAQFSCIAATRSD